MQNRTYKIVVCPSCGSGMWDNRKTKKNFKAPDYVCKQDSGECRNDKGFKTSGWQGDKEDEVFFNDDKEPTKIKLYE